VPWEARPTLSIAAGRAEGSDAVGVGAPLAGVAETGTLAYASGPESPATVNFLPETHIAVLRASDVVAAYEDVFTRVREKSHGRPFPRTVNFVTGPSRTADIELTLILGAHGPKRLHIVLVDDGEG
jgi:L-lactate dehydrogenase complex protein LldG